MSAQIVHIEIGVGGARVGPKSFLGGEFFGSYRSACDAHGFKWDKVRGSASRNVGPKANVPALAAELSRRGFTVTMDDAAKAILQRASETGLTDAQLLAAEHVEAMEKTLAERGLSLWKPFQTDGAIFLNAAPRALIADEMGTGKTIQILTALPVDAAVMVICPASVMVNWARECRKWRPEIKPVLIRKVSKREARYLAIDGIEVSAERCWPRRNEMVIYNYESSPTAYDQASPAKGCLVTDPVEGTVLVGDEIHRVKNRKAAMTQRWASLKDAVLAKGGRVWGASGTPMFNRPFDLSSILYGLGLFSDVFTSWKDFLRRMGGVESEWGIEWTGVIDPTVPTSLKRVMIRREKKDVMAFLPAKTYRTLTVDAGEALGKIGDELSDMLAARGVDLGALEAELERCQDDEERESLWRKVSIPFDQMSRLHALTSEMAFVGAQGLIEEYEEQGVPLVVFCWHKGPVEQIGAREGWTFITGDIDAMERNRRVIDFQAGKYKGIALTIPAGGVGITLTKASHMVFLSKSWSPAENRQAEDRCHRGGQMNPVLITSVVPDHPLTRRLNNLLGWKEQMHQDAIGAASLIKSMAETRKAEANAALARLDGDDERANMAAAEIDSRVDVRLVLGRIPAGRYALDSAPDAQGAAHTVFWHLDKPEDGRWAGWAFLKVQRGPETGRFSTIRPDGLASPAAAAVLEKIAVDPRAAAQRYGWEVGECSICGRALTDEASRRLGVGPTCAKIFRWEG